MKTTSELTAADIKSAFPNLTPNESEIVLAIMQRKLIGDFFSSVEKWVNQCYNEPRKDERRLEALNQLLSGHGIEGVTPEGEVYPKMSYVNMGDTYRATIVHDFENNDFFLCSWGDWLEKWEEENPREEDESETEEADS